MQIFSRRNDHKQDDQYHGKSGNHLKRATCDHDVDDLNARKIQQRPVRVNCQGDLTVRECPDDVGEKAGGEKDESTGPERDWLLQHSPDHRRQDEMTDGQQQPEKIVDRPSTEASPDIAQDQSAQDEELNTYTFDHNRSIRGRGVKPQGALRAVLALRICARETNHGSRRATDRSLHEPAYRPKLWRTSTGRARKPSTRSASMPDGAVRSRASPGRGLLGGRAHATRIRHTRLV